MIDEIKTEPEVKEKRTAVRDWKTTKDILKKTRALKEARLIVRNLPFKADENNVKDHFATYGNVLEVVLLRKGTKLVGCGFVQFDKKLSAAKAISKTSGKPFLGRTIVVDWAIPKNKFDKVHSKEDKTADVQKDIKDEPISSESEADNKEDSSEDESESETESERSEEPVRKEVKNTAKPIIKRESDTVDGRTIFIKNVPFSATNDELKTCVEQFGPVTYALVCIDPVTEHSRGTAFVRFESKDCADECLRAGTSFTLNGAVLEPMVALPKEKIPKKTEEKPVRDNRNLYLAKEGVVIAGTPAASGVSASDMSKRLALEHWKTQKLRQLNMFVSKTRLVVQNLPPSVTDKKLYTIFKENLPPNTAPLKVKVMRNLKDFDDKGVGKSKGFAFVDFINHSTALAALRAVNNNPNIFSPARRPIVSFSIENSSALKAKERRALKSKTSSDAKLEPKAPKKIVQHSSPEITQSKDFSGLNANFGNKKLLSRANLKKQALVHHEKVKQEKSAKKKNRLSRQKLRKMNNNQPAIQRNEADDFSQLVEKYKVKMEESSNKKKWYE